MKNIEFQYFKEINNIFDPVHNLYLCVVEQDEIYFLEITTERQFHSYFVLIQQHIVIVIIIIGHTDKNHIVSMRDLLAIILNSIIPDEKIT